MWSTRSSRLRRQIVENELRTLIASVPLLLWNSSHLKVIMAIAEGGKMIGETIRQNKEDEQSLDEDIRPLADMAKDWQNNSISETQENIEPANDTVEEAASAELEKNVETTQQLRERFLDDHYSRYNDPDDETANETYSCHSIVDNHFRWLQHDDNLLDDPDIRSYYKQRIKEEEKSIRRILGEWSPRTIADQYGDSIEKYGASLADLNVIMRGGLNTPFFNEYENGYERFCASLPGLIEEHFSDKKSEAYKKTMASIIRKLSYFYQYEEEPVLDMHGYEETGPGLSAEEYDFIANMWSDAKEDGFEYVPDSLRLHYPDKVASMCKNNSLLAGILDMIEFSSDELALHRLEKLTRK